MSSEQPEPTGKTALLPPMYRTRRRPDPESAQSSPPPPPPPSSPPGERAWPPYGSWRRAPLLPLVVIAAVVIVLVAGISSAAGVLVGVFATKNADSHSRFDDPVAPARTVRAGTPPAPPAPAKGRPDHPGRPSTPGANHASTAADPDPDALSLIKEILGCSVHRRARNFLDQREWGRDRAAASARAVRRDPGRAGRVREEYVGRRALRGRSDRRQRPVSRARRGG